MLCNRKAVKQVLIFIAVFALFAANLVHGAQLESVAASRQTEEEILAGMLLEEENLPEGELPEGELPEGELPEGELPEGELPEGELPEGELPEGELPEGELPEGELPEGELPEGELPEGELPEGELPEGELPEGEIPEEELPLEPELPLEEELGFDFAAFAATRSVQGFDATVEVDSYEKLKEALTAKAEAGKNYSIYVYLTADIFIKNGDGFEIKEGTTSNPRKIVIDGMNGSDKRRIDSVGKDETNSVFHATGNIDITVKNVISHVDSYFGLVNTHSSCPVTLQNVDFIGAQFVWGTDAPVTIDNCNIIITNHNGTGVSGDPGQEVLQAKSVALKNKVNIKRFLTQSNITAGKVFGIPFSYFEPDWKDARPITADVTIAHGVFWMYGGDFIVESGANVWIDDEYYIFYVDGNLDFIMQPESRMEIYTCGGFSYYDDNVNNFTVSENAEFYLTQKKDRSVAANYHGVNARDSFTLESGSVFVNHINTGNGFQIRGSAKIDNPRYVSIYHPKGALSGTGNRLVNIIDINSFSAWTTDIPYYQAPISFDYSANPQFNDIDTVPNYLWHGQGNDFARKFDLSVSATGGKTISLKWNAGASTMLANLVGATTGEELTSVLKSKGLYTNAFKRVVFGNAMLAVDPIKVSAGGITGQTDAGAQVQADYPVGGVTITKTAEAPDGSFFVSYDGKLPLGGKDVSVRMNFNGLRLHIPGTTVGELLLLEVPGILNYPTQFLPATSVTVRRDEESDDTIRVLDTRGDDEADEWKLGVQVAKVLTNERTGHELPNALVYQNATIDAGGNKMNIPLHLNEFSTIYVRGTQDVPGEETKVIWGQEDGILVQLKPGEAQIGKYNAILQWAFLGAP